MIILYSCYMAVKTVSSRIWTCTQVQYWCTVQGFPEPHDKAKGLLWSSVWRWAILPLPRLPGSPC